ncbi:hypothetical protein AAP_04381 [Ascosphaera apis ARSEF 7405]|uniref:Uncharacterized protein n=1 Tax=Ascosphaera apis ARSEF 7405 TaxID=392613 RepID=A0A167WT09_9EURO|nr:hypothetical protein AAP_04381 [Ascosphaera apis ARSEF 7405]
MSHQSEPNQTSTPSASSSDTTTTTTAAAAAATASAATGNDMARASREELRQQQTRSPWEQDWIDDSPFALFRRYADEQISSMLQAVVGLPSAFHPPAAGNWLYFEEQGPAVLARSRENGPSVINERGGGEDTGNNNESGRRNSWYDAVQSKSREDGRDNPRQEPNDDDRFSFNDFFEDTRQWLGRPFQVSFFDELPPPPFFDWPLRSSAWIQSHFFPNSHFFDSIISSHGPGWALPYILFSPYSPIHLERTDQTRRKPRGQLESWFGTPDVDDTEAAVIPSTSAAETSTTTSPPDWRLAFEDLLRIEAGKSMLDVSSKEMWKKESGADWIYGMIERGSLGDQWKLQRRTGRHGEDLVSLSYEDDRSKRNWEASSSRTVAKDQGKEIDGSTQSEPATELDLYDPPAKSYLDDNTADREQRQPEQQSHNTTSNKSLVEMIQEKAKALRHEDDTPNKEKPVRVVSTLISTERKTMPDGSIHSKTVRTKRYSDGREEKSEWVETTNPDDANGDGKNNRRNSWFW